MSSAVLTARAVTKSFGGLSVLDGVDLDVAPGSVVCVLGRNGAGKTTLIRVLLGMLAPDSGVVELDGVQIDALGPGYYREVAAVLEGADNTYGFLTGWSNLEYLGAMSGLSRAEVRRRSAEYVDALGLGDHMPRRAGDFSLGMRQKLAVVAAVMTRPRVAFLDEPTLGLDVVAKDQVLGFVDGMARARGTAFVVTSHQSDVVAAIGDEIVVLDQGRVLFAGPARAFRQQFGAGESRFVLEDSPAGREARDVIVGSVGQAVLSQVHSQTVDGELRLEVPSAYGEGAWRNLAESGGAAAVVAYSRRMDDIESILRSLYGSESRGPLTEGAHG